MKRCVKNKSLRVLFITSQWPTEKSPGNSPFVKREVAALRSIGITVDVLQYIGGWRPLRYLRAIWQMHRMLSLEPYDIIHVRFGQCGLVGRAQKSLPVVITFGGSDIEAKPSTNANFKTRLQYWILQIVSHTISRYVSEVIVVSSHLGEKLPCEYYHVIPSGLDLDLFKPIDGSVARTHLELPADKKLILFVGNPQKPIKRYELAVQAVQLAQVRVPNIELILLQNRPPEDVPKFMSACDVLIVTSTNEGSPNVVKEALACNLPVVSVDVGDVRERVNCANNCIVTEDDSAEKLAEALISVLSYSDKSNLRPLVEHLDQNAWALKVFQVYQMAITRYNQ